MPAKQAENIGNFQILRFWGRKHTPAHQSAYGNQTDEQMDSTDALSPSRCHERRLNNLTYLLIYQV